MCNHKVVGYWEGMAGRLQIHILFCVTIIEYQNRPSVHCLEMLNTLNNMYLFSGKKIEKSSFQRQVSRRQYFGVSVALMVEIERGMTSACWGSWCLEPLTDGVTEKGFLNCFSSSFDR